MSDTEIARVVSRLEVDRSGLKSGLSSAMSDILRFDKESSHVLSNIGSGFDNTFKKNDFKRVGQEMADSLMGPMASSFGSMGGLATSAAAALGPVGIALGTITAGTVAIGSAATQAAMAWESLGSQVGRTTSLKGQELANLMNDLQDVRVEMGLTKQEAAAMAEQAGSLGVGESAKRRGDMVAYRKELSEFVKTNAIVAGAFGMSKESTATGLGALGAATVGRWNEQRAEMGRQELSWSVFAENVGGSLDQLGNNMGSSEEGIITALTHISESVNDLAPTEADYGKWAGLASFMVELTPTSPDTAGESIKDAFNWIQRDKDSMISSLLGTDQAGVVQKMKTDAVGTVKEIGKAIAALPPEDRIPLWKGFGDTGAKMMKAVVADIESGTDRLDYAIELGVKGFNEGDLRSAFAEVADDATFQAGRISEAFQVALEKAGTMGLPAVSEGLAGIADGMVSAISTGERLYTIFSDISGTPFVQQGMGLAGEMSGALWQGTVGNAWSWGDQILSGAEQLLGIEQPVEEAVLAGTAEGMAAGAEAAAPSIEKVLGAAGKTWGDSFKELIGKGISPEIAMYMASGVSDADALAMINSQTGGRKDKISVTKLGEILGSEYTRMDRSTGQGVYTSILKDGETLIPETFSHFKKTGMDASEEIAQVYYDDLKGSIINVGAFMTDHYERLGDRVGDIFSDGILTDMEKAETEAYKALLDILEKEHPVEFKAAGLDDIRKQIDDLGKTAIEIDLKPIWEDWSSPAYAQKWFVENQDVSSQLTEDQAREFAATRAKYEELSNSENEVERTNAQNIIGAIDLVVAANQDGTLKYAAAMDVALGILAKLDPALVQLGSAINTLAANYAASAAGGRGMSAGDFYNQYYASRGYTNLNSVVAGTVPTTATNTSKMVSIGSGYRKAVVGSDFLAGLNRYASGGYVDEEQLAVVGEEPELIIPVSDLEGLYPKSPNVKKGSMEYYSGYNEFQNYPYEISGPNSYQWSKYPNPPSVMVSGDVPVAWLSDKQYTGMDYISSEIRERQLRSIGNSLVQPWFARGYQDQPEWWTSAAADLSPKYADAWKAQKGGVVPKIGADTSDIEKYDAWSAIYDDSGTCIGYVPRDESLNFKPGEAYLPGGKWYNGPGDDDSIQELESIAGFSEDIADNTAMVYSGVNRLNASINAGQTGLSSVFPILRGAGGGGAQTGAMSWLGDVDDALTRRTAWNAIYDNSGTCIAFVEPDPSLNFTPGKDYLPGGKGLGNMGEYATVSLGDQEISTWDSVAQSAAASLVCQEQIEENTSKAARYGELAAEYQSRMSQVFGSGSVVGASGGMAWGSGGLGSGSGISGFANRGGGWYWGGTSISGGGAHIGGGASSSGWGAQASSSAGTSGSYGGVSWGWAEGGAVNIERGGLVDQPTLFLADGRLNVVGETKKPELILPLSDPRRTKELLRQYLPEVRGFAEGGLVGGASIGSGSVTVNYTGPTINGAGLSEAQIMRILERDRKEFKTEIEEALYNARRR